MSIYVMKINTLCSEKFKKILYEYLNVIEDQDNFTIQINSDINDINEFKAIFCEKKLQILDKFNKGKMIVLNVKKTK